MRNSYIEGLNYKESHPFYKDSKRVAEKFDTETNIENGIVRWKTNNAIPPKDILEFWDFLGYNFDFKACIETQNKENNEFLSNYRKNYKGPSEEELYEMRAAFGEGETIVNIITGKEIKL